MIQLPTMNDQLTKTRLAPLVLALFALFVSACDPVDGLVVKDKEAYLQIGQTKTALAADGSVYRLRMQDGALVAKPIPGLKPGDAQYFSQFSKPQPMGAGTYTIEKASADRKTGLGKEGFAFVNGKERIQSKSRIGMLITFWEGKFQFSTTTASTECSRNAVTFTADRVVFNEQGAHSFFTWEAETVTDEDGNVVKRRQLMGDVATPTVPNDTGIEIIIVDTFTPESCCDQSFLECNEDDAPPTEAQPVAPADGWAIAATHSIGHACVYEVCGNIVVADQLTGEIRCYNAETCQVRIQHNRNGSFSVLLPTDCDTSACVTICPPKH